MRSILYILTSVTLFMGSTAAIAYDYECNFKPKLINLSTVDSKNISHYVKNPDEQKKVLTIMQKTHSQMGRGGSRSVGSCLRARFSMRIDGIQTAFATMTKTPLDANEKLEILGECIREVNNVKGLRSFKERVRKVNDGGFDYLNGVIVLYLYDGESRTAYPYWIGGHDVYNTHNYKTKKSRDMINSAYKGCTEALNKAKEVIYARLRRELLRDAPKYRVDKRRNKRRFNGRPPMSVPPMLPPVLAY